MLSAAKKKKIFKTLERGPIHPTFRKKILFEFQENF